MTLKQPPRIATWMLEHLGCGPDVDAVLGDLAEQYQQKRSAIWYWRQVLKAIPVSFVREAGAHKLIAARALITGWTIWILGLMWFFPLVSPYFFNNSLGVAFSPDHVIASVASLVWVPVGAPIGIGPKSLFATFVFGSVLPFVLATICGWLVARLHRGQQRVAVFLFAGSILFMDLLFFGYLVAHVGSRASTFAGPLAAYAAVSAVGILLGGEFDCRANRRVISCRRL